MIKSLVAKLSNFPKPKNGYQLAGPSIRYSFGVFPNSSLLKTPSLFPRSIAVGRNESNNLSVNHLVPDVH